MTAPGRQASPALNAWRRLAAEASGGDSSLAVHTTLERIIRTQYLQGDLLDFGAGKGLVAARLLETDAFNSVTATDIMPRPSLLPGPIKWIAADLNQPLDLPDSLFDAIVALEVIEHLENPRALARELFRLLRPQGTLILPKNI